jgi:hypothetical protein
MSEKSMILFRAPVLTIALALACSTAASAQFPARPAPAQIPTTAGDDKERAVCHPDVIKFCQSQLQINPNDTLGILGCLQTNRANISATCQQVLSSHGQ